MSLGERVGSISCRSDQANYQHVHTKSSLSTPHNHPKLSQKFSNLEIHYGIDFEKSMKNTTPHRMDTIILSPSVSYSTPVMHSSCSHLLHAHSTHSKPVPSSSSSWNERSQTQHTLTSISDVSLVRGRFVVAELQPGCDLFADAEPPREAHLETLLAGAFAFDLVTPPCLGFFFALSLLFPQPFSLLPPPSPFFSVFNLSFSALSLPVLPSFFAHALQE